ncbi:MAG: hypothetical protein UT45_C0004G0038 [Candidatus Daviesbacteria bacterium GW2011_GWA2_39_33]|nr:MAG: hypothetical protein UT45_C0004G0038 [Candidatus Daviesbacteria bacterium GW2011_GWA2_39_33]
MNSHNVVFIDDDTNYIDDFRLAGEDLSVNVPVVELVPSINELVNTIIDINPDAVVVDFQLRETRSDIKYDGADVLKLLEEKTYDLPKFIFTSFPSEAEDAASDINIVYDKDSDKLNPLMARVVKQIDKHRKMLSLYDEELGSLLKKKGAGDISFKEEERIIELDSILEKTLNREAVIPDALKTTSVMTRLDEIFSKTKELVDEIQKEK